MAKLYTVEITRVDFGSYAASYRTIKAATSAAALSAFSFAGHNGAIEAGETLIRIRRRSYQRVTYEPGNKAWSITIRKHGV